ncbi:MAG TPA: chorismate mutase [Micromonosporaceae bacterium]
MNAATLNGGTTAPATAQAAPVGADLPDQGDGVDQGKPAAEAHIAELRERIDEIDQTLIDLWRERAAISREVGLTRLAAGGTRLVLAREQEILARFREALGADGTQLAMLILRAGRGRLV